MVDLAGDTNTCHSDARNTSIRGRCWIECHYLRRLHHRGRQRHGARHRHKWAIGIYEVEGLEVIFGKIPHCACQLEARLHLCRKQGDNFNRTFFRCPLKIGRQCRFFQWTIAQPFLQPEQWQGPGVAWPSQMSMKEMLTEMVQRTLSTPHHDTGRNQRLLREGDLQDMQETAEKPTTSSSHGDFKQGDNRGRLQGISAVSEVEAAGQAGQEGLELKPLPPRMERKIRAALKKAVSFWKQIQGILVSCGNDDVPIAGLLQKFNQEICDELKENPQRKQKES